MVKKQPLFYLAGSVGRIANGYFFEKTSADFLDKFGTEIIDPEGKTVAIIPGLWLDETDPLYRQDILDKSLRYTVKVNTSPDAVDFLWKLRSKLLDNLRGGSDIWESYLVAGVCMGGEELIDKSEITKNVVQLLKEMLPTAPNL